MTMKRYGILKKKSIVLLLFALFLVPVIQGGSSPATQNTLIQNKNSSSAQSNPVTSSDPLYAPTPDWVSSSPHYSTGAAFADFNNDHWLDFIVSDGNDMGQGHVRVYLNDGNGHLPTTASWESADIAYNGHLDVADINGDSWPDVAVSYLGTSSSLGPIARVYMNTNGVLSSSPTWTANIIGNAFGVDFGDMNNDGRPDLAIATGWSYNSYHYHTYVYLNDNGAYGSTPSWQSADQNIYMSCLWVDADDDGWLDLAGIGDSCQTQIYHNLNGTLETTASWYSTDSANQFGIMLTAGDVTGDGVRDLFTTDNTQLGGDGYFKQYTGVATGFFEQTHSWGYYGDYGSSVALADLNGDTLLDLATGAWWFPTNIFLNQGTGLPSTPSWSSTDETVVEKIVFGNIGPSFCEQTYTEQFAPSGDRRLFYLPHRQIQGINSVVCDGCVLAPSEYTTSREEGWITINTAPFESLEVTYRYSASQDMAVTNWDPEIGNYLYYNKMINNTIPGFNTTPYRGSDLECNGSLSWGDITPGATVLGSFTLSNDGDFGTLLDWEVLSYPEWGTWMFSPASGFNLPAGDSVTVQVTVVVPNEENTQFQGEITIINIDKNGDSALIPVTVTTPYHSDQLSKNLRYSIVLEHLRSIACISQKPLL
jgi:FG-GAP-like repeat/FG-GAP repeat